MKIPDSLYDLIFDEACCVFIVRSKDTALKKPKLGDELPALRLDSKSPYKAKPATCVPCPFSSTASSPGRKL
jgi:hypothetical protein